MLRPAASNDGTKRLVADRSRLFNLEETRRLETLFRVPADKRDDAWVEALYDSAWYASVAVHEPPNFDGPDGFPYYRFDLPRPNAPFEAQSLGNLARDCAERHAGAAFFASADDPAEGSQFVLSTGLLDSLLRFDSAQGDPLDRAETSTPDNPDVFTLDAADRRLRTLTVTAEHQVLTGSPAADFLLPYTARGLHRYMSHIWGIADPRVHLLVDQNLRPSRNLAIGRKRSSFASDAEVSGEMRRLFWFLPPNRAIILMPENGSLDTMERLADLGG